MIELISTFTGYLFIWTQVLLDSAALIGAIMVLAALALAGSANTSRQGLQQGVTMGALAKMAIIGVILLAIDTTIGVGSRSFFASSPREIFDISAPTANVLTAESRALLQFVYRIVWFVGLIAVLRGFWVEGFLGQNQSRGGGSGKGFIFAGLAGMNLVAIIELIANSVAAAPSQQAQSIADAIRVFVI